MDFGSLEVNPKITTTVVIDFHQQNSSMDVQMKILKKLTINVGTDKEKKIKDTKIRIQVENKE